MSRIAEALIVICLLVAAGVAFSMAYDRPVGTAQHGAVQEARCP